MNYHNPNRSHFRIPGPAFETYLGWMEGKWNYCKDPIGGVPTVKPLNDVEFEAMPKPEEATAVKNHIAHEHQMLQEHDRALKYLLTKQKQRDERRRKPRAEY